MSERSGAARTEREEERGAGRHAGFLGTLRDALRAAGREDAAEAVSVAPPRERSSDIKQIEVITLPPPQSPSAAEAALLARRPPPIDPEAEIAEPQPAGADSPPTTRVVRGRGRAEREEALAPAQASFSEPGEEARTQLVRGRRPIERGAFASDPVVGFLVVVGGPGLGAFRPIFEGNNSIGRSPRNRIALDFGDEAISSDEQAYVRYDGEDRSFLLVPNLAKTNVVSVNAARPTAAVKLAAMDVITLGRTQVAFVPFCGAEFDWSEISETQV